MTFDQNPKFGKDLTFSEGARRVVDLLWDTTDGDLTKFPQSYLETLRHDYSDGKVSMLELIDKVDLGDNATYEEYCEVVDALMQVDPATWPNADSVVEIQPSQLLYEFKPDFDFSEFDFAEEVIEESVTVEEGVDPLSAKMETFFKKVISSVYLDGVTEVTDMEGNPPTSANNYLLSEDGKTFSGIFYDSPPNENAKQFPFQINEKGEGNWEIKY